MASNVFGNPITNETLEAKSKYVGKTITHFDRAHEAYNMKNSEKKDANARNYVENMKNQYGSGVSTLCVFYNATGDPIKYVDSHDWHGHISSASYPEEIANGQWGGFLHVHPGGTAVGSAAEVVYRGENSDGIERDFMCSWSNPWWRTSDCKAYTEVRAAGHFEGKDEWDYLQNLTEDSKLNHTDIWGGCQSSVIIGDDTTAVYEAILTLVAAAEVPD